CILESMLRHGSRLVKNSARPRVRRPPKELRRGSSSSSFAPGRAARIPTQRHARPRTHEEKLRNFRKRGKEAIPEWHPPRRNRLTGRDHRRPVASLQAQGKHHLAEGESARLVNPVGPYSV